MNISERIQNKIDGQLSAARDATDKAMWFLAMNRLLADRGIALDLVEGERMGTTVIYSGESTTWLRISSSTTTCNKDGVVAPEALKRIAHWATVLNGNGLWKKSYSDGMWEMRITPEDETLHVMYEAFKRTEKPCKKAVVKRTMEFCGDVPSGYEVVEWVEGAPEVVEVTEEVEAALVDAVGALIAP